MLIALGLVAALGGFMLLVARRPDVFTVARSATIAAPPQAVFALLDDFHQWPRWSPWEKLDPQMKRTFSGAPRGEGAVYSWAGNRKAGEGRMTITGSRPAERLAIQLEFFKPWVATNAVEFLLRPAAGGVDVEWTMTGRNNFAFKAMQVFMNMERLVGGDFEKGLAELKRVAEARPG